MIGDGIVCSGRRLAAILGFAALLWLPGYVRRDLWEPDEARYAYVAGEMLRDGHVAVLHRSGELYAHKPPLMFWLMQAGAPLTGGTVTRLSARLPSLLGVVLTLWATVSIAGLWDGPKTAARSGLVTATIYLVWKQAGWGQIDMLLCGLQTTGLWMLLAGDRASHAGRSLAAFACFGLAILAKGPVGLLVPVGVYLAMHAVARDWRPLARAHWVWGLLVVAAFPAAWLLLAWQEGAPPAYFHELLFKQNLDRAAGDLGHGRPWHYFLPYLAGDALPWSLLAPAAYLVLRGDAATARWRRQALVWIAFVVIFFSIPASKRGLYILMAYPALGILIAAAWTRATGQRLRSAAVGVGLLAALLVLPAAAVPVAAWRADIPLRPGLLLPAGLVGLAGAGAAVWTYARQGLTARLFAIVAAASMALFWLAGTVLLPALNPSKTPEALVPFVARHVPDDAPLLLYRMHGEILALYSARQGEVHWSADALWNAVARRRRGVVVFENARWLEEAPRYRPIASDTLEFAMGGKRLMAVAFGSPP